LGGSGGFSQIILKKFVKICPIRSIRGLSNASLDSCQIHYSQSAIGGIRSEWGDTFSDELKKRGIEVHVVGDANIPARKAIFAVEEGAKAGLKI